MADDRFLGIWESRRDALAGIAAVAAGIALIVGVVAACGVLPDFDGVEESTCLSRGARPFTGADVVAAFSAQDVALVNHARSRSCMESAAADAIVGDLSNTPDSDDLHVICTLYRRPLSARSSLEADLDASSDSPIFSGRKAEFDLANVSCNAYPGSDDDAQIARAHEAMKALERQLRD